MKLYESKSHLSASCRINTEYGGQPQFVVTGRRHDGEGYEVNEIVHNRSEAIKLRNALTRMLRATAPPPKKRKAA